MTVPLARAPLATRWAAGVSAERPWPEHPRPHLRRDAWLCLNGPWDYAVTRRGREPRRWDGRIRVPFPLESALSGVGRALRPDETLWYRRGFALPATWGAGRVMLRFGAVDHTARVWLNGAELGRHRGGFAPFAFEATAHLRPDGPNELRVAVRDPTDGSVQRGKQSRRPRLVFYTAVSGIWQTVWLEPVPETHVARLRLAPDPGLDRLRVEARVDGPDAAGLRLRATARDGDRVVGRAEGAAGEALVVPVATDRHWSPDAPHLHDLEVELLGGDGRVDRVESYFGLRHLDVGRDAGGRPRLRLNGEPLFQLGPLDQGYWPDGLYTAPCDAALRFDVEACKRLGFNCVRKHLKVEPARWYHHCDRLGLLVWQDLPSGGGVVGPALLGALQQATGCRVRDDRALWRFGRGDPAAREAFRAELGEIVDALESAPCLAGWVPFNEGWGQFGSASIAEWLRARDPGRPVDAASGWFDQGAGDVHSVHRYPGPAMPPVEERRAAAVSEFGGIGLAVEGHRWHPRRTFAYRRARSREELVARYAACVERLGPLVERGLAQAIYTQLTDVEIEVNGLLTYDREVWKIDPERAAALHHTLRERAARAAARR